MRRRSADQLVADVGYRIRELRIELELTQEALAEKLELSQQYLRRVESGGVSISIRALAKFAKALKVEPAELLQRPKRRVKRKPGRPRTT